MRCATVAHGQLATASRWTPAFFFGQDNTRASRHGMVALGQVAVERKEAVDPQSLGPQAIAYLGLENIRARTGELVEFAPRPASSIQSRSKIFRTGDVLFGKLRPELNKVYLVDGEPASGLCSGEFVVLTPIAAKVSARYLRHIMASPFVGQHVESLRRGASLPRISASDLLGIKIPLPPLALQQQLAQQLEQTDREIRALRSRLEALPDMQLAAFLHAIESGPQPDPGQAAPVRQDHPSARPDGDAAP
jgi:hypothetical protein